MQLFCCSSIQAYRPQILSHEQKFRSFLEWAAYPKESAVASDSNSILEQSTYPYVVQLVQQVNYGPVESKRYFAQQTNDGSGSTFVELTEYDLIQANYQKLNAYKNYRCSVHNKFFELNIYQKDPVNKHHWRYNIARPSGDIDLK